MESYEEYPKPEDFAEDAEAQKRQWDLIAELSAVTREQREIEARLPED